ncbi:sulfite exporter TauE/SafE family protein [Sediminibacterium sp.]|uniref:sulfite exporter TauE/SafE family protein n=1 Tax=Sediminibacterium sp. TaxID=1917865 RepID=UPI00271C7BB2|nr:sulfite exporter TauE/SafE family protein [Sediminibacterium sp.]MDO8995598.1 sulfite exporter TauE/SafE family protein [Sediminibacterium sp.]MDP1971611.1 sulfite exporter TauE/SafE family protein [Sediminibacterium sp.]MDP2421257.1 sulfite exporter TauE/SafE family protein [Sediminibacterium sp.]
MSATTLLVLVLIGLFAGFLSGLVGIGGGIIMVPTLVFFLGLTQKQAQGTSLGVLMLPVVALAVWQYHKQGQINFNYVFLIAVSFIIGGFLGSKLALSLSDDKMKKIFAVVLLLLSIKMLFFDKKKNISPTQSTKIEQTISH